MTITMFEFDSDFPDPPLPKIHSQTHAELASVGARCSRMFVFVFFENKNEHSVESLSLINTITSSSSSSSIHPEWKLLDTGENWVQELEDDVRTEAEKKYGRVLHISVDPNSNGEIYLKFEKISGGENAIKGLNGRYFGGRMVTAQPVVDAVYSSLFRGVGW